VERSEQEPDYAQHPDGPAATATAVPAEEEASQIGSNPAPIGPVLQAHIGKQLRAVFQSVLAEPVPSRFVELLESLEKKGTE
jgi:Anti-sigma factor NepR